MMSGSRTSSWTKIIYRLRGFPEDFNREDLNRAIQEAYHIQPTDFKLHSFSLDIEEEGLPRQKVATITFRSTPAELCGSENQEWIFEIASTPNSYADVHRAYLDTHFKGLTPLTPEDADEKCDIDCVFVHGWGGNPLGSLVADDPTYVWFRDDLPSRFPKLRIWTYGYGSKLTDENYISDPFEDAERLKDALQSFRYSSEKERPIIFIVHSLGGLIFKQATISMSKSNDPDDKKNLQLIKGALFFGVPEQGMDVTALASMVYGLPSQYTLNLLNENFGFRQRDIQDDDFHRIWPDHGFNVISFFEMRKTPTVAKTANGWERTGPFSLLVKPSSATSGRYNQQGSGSKISLDKDHSSMIKLSRNDREDYRKVWKAIQRLIDNAQNLVHGRVEIQHPSKEQRQELELQQCFVDELYNQILQSRTRQISEAADGTYEWIFSDQEDRSTGFSEWLSGNSDLYWITGKPGSGKSTLIKFVAKHAKTKVALQEWAGSAEVVTASFYFWISGTPLQRSLIGLLQSIFHQILDHDHDLIRALFPREWRFIVQSKPIKWTEHSFMDAVDRLKDFKQDSQRKFCFFIDGLDEYQGDEDHEWLCHFLVRLGGLAHVKLCVSSRYWVDFQTAFSKYPTLKLHEWTSSDIDKFIDQEFGEHSAWTELCEAEPRQAGSLVRDISLHAQGVFLWVCLVVRSLIKGLNKGDSLEQLKASLNTMPKTLNGFFNRIIGDLREEDRDFAIKALLVTKTLHNPSPFSMSYLQENDPAFGQNITLRTDSLGKLKITLSRAKRRLAAICSDLLIVVEEDEYDVGEVLLPKKLNSICTSVIAFVHRTLGDYLNSPAGSALLVSHEEPSFDAHTWHNQVWLIIFKIFMTHLVGFDSLRALSVMYEEWKDESHNFYKEDVGRVKTLPSFQFLDELDKTFDKYFKAISIRARHWSSVTRSSHPWVEASNFLEYAVGVPLFMEYVVAKLQSPEDVLNTMDFQRLFDHALGVFCNSHLNAPFTDIDCDCTVCSQRKETWNMIQQASLKLFQSGIRSDYLSLEPAPLNGDQVSGDVAFNLMKYDLSGKCSILKTYRSTRAVERQSKRSDGDLLSRLEEWRSRRSKWYLYVNTLYVLRAPRVLQSPNACWKTTYPEE